MHTHTNELIHETSPYLLQHAHNPVNWYPWGEQALEKAKAEDKPILISIGYSACHWCHVMERESFEDIGTAELMNKHFINIKIDREERPDLDHIYMDAVQAMTGSGGWPLNVFLTPEGKPFFGGTYFPPVKAYNRSSWQDILTGVSNAYHEKKQDILSQAEHLTQHLLKANAFGSVQPGTKLTESLFSEDQLKNIADNILENADTEWGGFGKAPKFPQTFLIQYLLRHYHFTKDKTALDHALLSLDKMIEGGINDQLGGGFARYSIDVEWLAPHFEKMLYDNALLVGVISEAYQITGKESYANALKMTLSFIERELTHEAGGFYSALDADSEGVEGKFYTWQKAEIDALMGEDGPVYCAFYDVSDAGNWEHTNILRVKESLSAFAKKQGMAEKDLEDLLTRSSAKLMETRSKRIRPMLDDKLLLGWNAMMNTAYAKAFAALGNPAYREMAIRNMQFLESVFQDAGGSWFHTYKEGKAHIPAFLDDYACLIQAYIHLQEITGNGEYLIKARKITEWVIGNFVEESTGFFYYIHKGQTDVIVRKKEVYDGAVPSGNAIMAQNLQYLSIVFDLPQWAAHSSDLLASLGTAIAKYPSSFGVWSMALQNHVKGMLEIAITGQHARDFLAPVMKRFIPNKIIQAEETNSSVFPLLAGKLGFDKEGPAFYLCRNYACLAPFATVETLLANV